jgi:hypothetical protein
VTARKLFTFTLGVVGVTLTFGSEVLASGTCHDDDSERSRRRSNRAKSPVTNSTSPIDIRYVAALHSYQSSIGGVGWQRPELLSCRARLIY